MILGIKILISSFFILISLYCYFLISVTTTSLKHSDYLRKINSVEMSLKSKVTASVSESVSTSGINGISSSNSKANIPMIFYGTAWKKDRTKDLVKLAIHTGFRSIDTACQPRHYNEPGVGEALLEIYASQLVQRQDLFLQTKYTPIKGQDVNNMPYLETDSLEEQVKKSITTSLANLHTNYIDALLIHSPLPTIEETLQVWKVLESYQITGVIRYLGISNCYDLDMLKSIYEQVNIKPKFLQNRFYKETNYDKSIREFCHTNDIIYESFWTLTANPHILKRFVYDFKFSIEFN